MARPKDIQDDVETLVPAHLPALIYVSGRGNSGKTTLIRLIAELAMSRNAALVLSDCDRTNQSLTGFFGEEVIRPEYADDDSIIQRINEIINGAVEQGMSAIFDMGAGNSVFTRHAESMDLVPMLETVGIRPVALHCIGPAVDDLAVLNDIEEKNSFCPASTALVLNAGLIRDTRAVDASFAAIRKHPSYQAAIARGAREVVMPKLACMQKLDNQRMFFHAAAEGHVAEGQEPLGFMERQMVKIWLRQMNAALAPIADWLP